MLHICPVCRKLFALKYDRTEQYQDNRYTDIYGCDRCGEEVMYARRHPPHVV
jgi:hypothetical protein